VSASPGPSAGVLRHRWVVLLTGSILSSLLAAPARAAELKPETVSAFDRYVRATEARMAEDTQQGKFLLIDGLPRQQQQDSYARLRRGEILVEPLRTMENGNPIQVPHGLIHHWSGTVFIPGAVLSQMLAVLQDYDNHPNIYKPTIQRSKVLERDGDHFKVYVRMYRKQIVTVVVDVNLDDVYTPLGTSEVMSRSYSTRIAQIADPDKPTERELPVGNDSGYVWRFYTYWHIVEKDGGVYAQAESIALSRRVPVIFAWLINPLIKSIPRDLISANLAATRNAVKNTKISSNDSRPASARLPHQLLFRRLPPSQLQNIGNW
jgi:hypothetical protein